MLTDRRDCIAKYVGLLLIVLTLLTGLVGCVGPGPVMPAPLKLWEAVDIYNRNVAAIAPFRAGIFEWKVEFTDDEGKRQRHPHMGGRLYYVPAESNDKPSSFYLMTKAVFDEALVVGSNNKEYWMYIKPDKRGWWGKYEHQAKDCSEEMLIDPQMFLEFLGLRRLPSRQGLLGYKIVDGNNIIEYIEQVDNGYWIKREVIIDRRDNLPREINAYNKDGRRIMQSKLSDYKKLGDAWIPSDIKISATASDFYFRLKLWSFKKIKKDDRKLSILLTRPQRIKGVDKYQQIDKECEIK